MHARGLQMVQKGVQKGVLRRVGEVKDSKIVEQLADELFALVETAQGYAFISDGEFFGMSKSEFFARVRGRLKWSEKVNRLIRSFLRKYGEI
jgi:hypothetical protein